MGDIWDGFDFPTLDPVNPVNSNMGQAVEQTPSIESIDAMLVKRAMVVFFIIDISGSMKGARIGAVNDAIRNLLPELKKREASNTNAEIRVAILEFSSNANWRTLTPQPVSSFVYDDITYVSGGTNFGKAFHALNEKLTRNAFLSAAAGSYTPLIILLTDGKPSDIALYPEELNQLKKNSWFRYATKAGIAIEEGALSPECKKVLLEFTGNESMVLEAKNTNILSKQMELVTLTGVDFVTQQGSLQNIDLKKHGKRAGNQPVNTPMNGRTFNQPINGQAAQNQNMMPNQNMMQNQNVIPNQNVMPNQAMVSTPDAQIYQQMNQQPVVDVRAGENPVIPGMDDIDWDDFPVFS